MSIYHRLENKASLLLRLQAHSIWLIPKPEYIILSRDSMSQLHYFVEIIDQQQIQIERLTAVNRQLNEQSSSLQQRVEVLESENKQLAVTNDKLTSLLRSAKKKLGL